LSHLIIPPSEEEEHLRRLEKEKKKSGEVRGRKVSKENYLYQGFTGGGVRHGKIPSENQRKGSKKKNRMGTINFRKGSIPSHGVGRGLGGGRGGARGGEACKKGKVIGANRIFSLR